MLYEQLTVACASSVTKGYAWDQLFLEEICHVTWRGLFKCGEIGGFGVQAKVTKPEVGRDESADGDIIDRGSPFAWVSDANSVVAIFAIAFEAHVLLGPQLVKSPLVPRLGFGNVDGASTTLDACIVVDQRRHVVLVRHVLSASRAVHNPSLLARSRNKRPDPLRRFANRQR